jgi:hypothetical protein
LNERLAMGPSRSEWAAKSRATLLTMFGAGVFARLLVSLCTGND